MTEGSNEKSRPTKGAGWRQLGEDLPLMLRSVLFMVSITFILHHCGWLDWVDDYALTRLPSRTFTDNDSGPAIEAKSTVVLGITQDLFDASFGGHTPINRSKFQQLITEALANYPGAKVLAIDYDLSPSAFKAASCAAQVPADHTDPPDPGVCAIALSEYAQQQSFDDFLMQLPKRRQQLTVVMLAPFKGLDEKLSDAQVSWMQKISSADRRHILFADAALLRTEWLGTVTKRRSASHDAPAEDIPLADRVYEAITYTSPTAGRDSRIEEEQINFTRGRQTIKICALWEPKVSDSCMHDEDVRLVFIGALYGQEDRFLTPAGEMYGVVIHAYNTVSLACPVRELPIFLGVLLDILIGIMSSLTFGYIWRGAAASAFGSMRRSICIVFVFLLCSVICYALMHWALRPLMMRDLWLNPVLIIIGLFVDSYMSAMERIGRPRDVAHSHAQLLGGPLGISDFLGLSMDRVPLIQWPTKRQVLRIEPVFQIFKRLVVYWAVVLLAFWLMALSAYEEKVYPSKEQCNAFLSSPTRAAVADSSTKHPG